MNQNNIQQEILLFINTSLVRKTPFEKNSIVQKAPFEDELEQAVWNGLLDEMFPELIVPAEKRKSELFIWQIRTEECSLIIDLAETPHTVEYPYSIKPYLFLTRHCLN